MKRISLIAVVAWMSVLLLASPGAALAQESTPPAPALQQFSLVTSFPSRVIGIGESVTLKLQLEAAPSLQIVHLSMNQLPEGWTATFRGEGQIIDAVEVQPGTTTPVDLRLDPPADVASGAYHMLVSVKGDSLQAELPIDLTVKDKLPPRLSFSAELPTIKGAPSSTFRYSVVLKNEGDNDLNVNLTADTSTNFLVKFKVNSQEVTSLPLSANKSETISVEAQPLGDVTAGSYPITIHAQSEEAQTDLQLSAEVTGQAQLSVSAPDGRLSAQATAGRESPIKVVLQNTGTAPVRGVELSSTEPSGWSVTFDTKQVVEVPAGQQVEVTARIKPPEKAVAGDYVITIQAKPVDGASKSADFRITVVTATLWGVAGIGLIAVSVAVVGVAVGRFGRR